jgi:hypothetical protein
MLPTDNKIYLASDADRIKTGDINLTQVYLPDLDCFLCCVFSVLYCSVTLFSLLLFLFCALYCSFFLYCTVSACDVRAATLTEVFPCFFLSCKANARV